MTDSVNSNSVSIRSANWAFLINPNGAKEDRYIGIVSNMIDLPYKGILYAKQVHAAVNFYDDKPHKLGGKQRLVTTDSI